jgi:hypothetical protein
MKERVIVRVNRLGVIKARKISFNEIPGKIGRCRKENQ